MTRNKAMAWCIGRTDDNTKVSGKMANSMAEENTEISPACGGMVNGTTAERYVGSENDH
jgi:hypothetical protein